MDVDMKNREENDDKGIIVPVSSGGRDRGDRDRDRDRDYDKDRDRDDRDKDRRDRDKDRDRDRDRGSDRRESGAVLASSLRVSPDKPNVPNPGRSRRGGGDHWEPDRRNGDVGNSYLRLHTFFTPHYRGESAHAPGVVPALDDALLLPVAGLAALGRGAAHGPAQELVLGAVTANMRIPLPAP